jgi:hypothetical protein
MNWTVVGGPIPQPKVRDSARLLYVIERAGVRRDVIVELSGTLLACDHETLPSPLDDHLRTLGRSLIEQWPGHEDLPVELRLSSAGMVPPVAA